MNTVSKAVALADAIQALRNEAFDWRNHNCALTAATIVETYTGIDYAADFRPFCESPLSAMRTLKKAGGLEKVMMNLGFKQRPVKMAQRGDVMLLRWEHKGRAREALGILVDHRAVFTGRDGLEFRPQLDCAAAWRVE